MNKFTVIGYGFLGGSITDGLLQIGDSEVAVIARSHASMPANKLIRYHVAQIEDGLSSRLLLPDSVVIFAIGSTFPALAASEFVAYSKQEIEILRVAIQMTAARGKRFVYLSSAAIYGEVPYGMAKETDALFPSSLYGSHKMLCEEFCLTQARALGLPVTILRLSNPFGPRQSGKHLQGIVGIVLDNIKKNKITYIRGDGSSVRDYVPVSILPSVLIELFRKKTENIPKILNVCSGEGLSIKQLLKILSLRLMRDIPIQYSPEVIGEIRRSILDPSELLNFVPHLPDRSFFSGLEQFDFEAMVHQND